MEARDGAENRAFRGNRRKKGDDLEASPSSSTSSVPGDASSSSPNESPTIAKKRNRRPTSPPLRPSPSPPSSKKGRRDISPVASSSPLGFDDAVDEMDDIELPPLPHQDSLLLSLPHELLLRVLERLEPKSLARASGVCVYLRMLCPTIWMNLSKAKYPSVRTSM